MKKNLFIYAALCALVAAGCSKQDEAETLQPGQGEAINVTVSATRHEAPSTRTEYEDTVDKLIVKWNSDMSDKLGVFTTDNGPTSNAEFSVDGDLSADGKTAHFKGSLTISDPVQETTVYGYYPYSSATEITPAAIPIDLSSQTQVGITDKTSLAHLAAKDYMAATPVTKNFSNGKQNLSLEFNPLLAIISFKITQEMNVESIKLEAVGESNSTPFHTQGTVDITTTDKTFPITGSGTAQSSVELRVTNGVIANNAPGMFNMMIFPMETGNTQFKVTVTTTTGIVYTQTMDAPAQGFVRGKRYIKVLDGLTKDDTSDVWDGTPPDADDSYTYSGGTGTKDTPYRISTAKDLAQLAANVNAEFDSKNHFSLTKNINLDNKEWTPIGIWAGDNPTDDTFKGTFDGNGYSVTGLYININSDKQFLGLFGDIYNGTVKNLNVTGDITSNYSDQGNVGGIAGSIYNSYIIGCSYSGSVTSTGYSTQTGGICGSVSGYVIGCYNTSTVTSTQDNMSYCGGIAGSTSGGYDGIIGCYNTGIVTGTNGTRVGGIVATNQAKVMGCYNTGSVIGTNVSDASCGGIIGKNSSDNITGCLWVKSSDAGTATAGIGEETGAGTIPPFDNLATLNSTDNIAALNSAIDAWNSDTNGGNNTTTRLKYCHFKFNAGADGTTTPTLTDGVGTY